MRLRKILYLTLFTFSLLVISHARAEEYGMYVKVVENISSPFEDIVKSSEQALSDKGWKVLASYQTGTPKSCNLRAHTIVVYQPDYARKLLALEGRAAFAIPLRVSIYEDDKGVSLAFLNPASLNRTVLGDHTASELSVDVMNSLSEIISSAVKGDVVNLQAGSIRQQGLLGGMGGGEFSTKILEIYGDSDTKGAYQETARKVKEGILANDQEWQLRYTLHMKEANMVIYGVDKASWSAAAFEMAGEKRQSETNPCPGIDHAPAFPYEVVVSRDEDRVRVEILEGMYRLKLFFEDAGRSAFFKNMNMPGMIQRELTSVVRSHLKE